MKRMKTMMILAMAAAIGFTGCKPKDADIKAAVETKLKADAAISNPSADVKDGVATIMGEVKDEAAKSTAGKEAEEVKNVKSVVNNITVVAPPEPVTFTPPVIAADTTLNQSVADATKDFPGVKADIMDGVITLTGEIKRDALPKLMMSLNALKPKKIENKLTIK